MASVRNPLDKQLRAAMRDINAPGPGRTKMKGRRRSKARRMPPRNAKGRFVKRSVRKVARRRPVRARRPKAVKRPAARRSPVRRKVARGRGGRFVSSLARRYSAKYVRRARRRPTKTGKHMRAVKRISRGQRVAGLVRINPREAELLMMNPRRKRRRPQTRIKNPRRARRQVRRNPSLGSIQNAATAAVPIALGGAAGGLVAGALDAKFLAEKPLMVRAGVKAVTAVVADIALRKRAPRVGKGIVGGLMGSLGYDFGVNMAGGIIAHNKRDAVKKVALKGLSDPEMAAMMGDVVDTDMLQDIADGAYDEALQDVIDAA